MNKFRLVIKKYYAVHLTAKYLCLNIKLSINA